MTDKVLVPVAGLGVLALEVETYRVALAEGARLAGPGASASPPTQEALLDADQLSEALGNVPTSWIEAAGRDGRIPSVQCGRWRRFRRSAVEQALAHGKGGA